MGGDEGGERARERNPKGHGAAFCPRRFRHADVWRSPPRLFLPPRDFSGPLCMVRSPAHHQKLTSTMPSFPARLFATSSRLAAAHATHATHVPASNLPPVLYRRIAKHISQLRAAGETTQTVSIPNPFLLHRSTEKATYAARDSYSWHKPQISPRRQKQLLQFYPAEELPVSALNTQSEKRSVVWEDGTIVTWAGKVREKTQKVKQGPYAGRKIMFKGHLDERKRPQKLAERQERLDGMPKRIADWRKVSWMCICNPDQELTLCFRTRRTKRSRDDHHYHSKHICIHISRASVVCYPSNSCFNPSSVGGGMDDLY